MSCGLERSLNQLVDNVFGGGPVRVSHAKVDDVFSAAARGHFHFTGDIKDISRQTLYSAELFHNDSSLTALRLATPGKGHNDPEVEHRF
jgi:hypothetical protein